MLYDSAGLTADADLYAVVGDQTLSGITFGDDYQIQSGRAFLQPASLTVTATYNGTAFDTGTGNIYVYLYTSRPTASRTPTPAYTGVTAAPATVGVASDISIPSIAPGNYFMLVFYDYASGTNPDNRYDRYILYDNTGSSAAATTVSISGAATATGVSFDDTHQIGSSNALEP
ncbi:MAG: hypothetical protein JW807_16340 [Spirochaetes bacterium]|nr:hypothetical protein [Spirochaetota bacterium]